MIEYELKYMLDADAYDACLDKLTAAFGKPAERTQINYYYDTPDLALHKAGTTLRIRQNGERIQGQIKRHSKGGSNDSRESFFAIDAMPCHMEFRGTRVKLLGSLMTVRRVFTAGGMEIDLDLNYYLGNVDRELEIEFQNGCETKAKEFADSLGIRLGEVKGGKYSRFLKALKKARKAGVVLCEGRSGETAEIK